MTAPVFASTLRRRRHAAIGVGIEAIAAPRLDGGHHGADVAGVQTREQHGGPRRDTHRPSRFFWRPGLGHYDPPTDRLSSPTVFTRLFGAAFEDAALKRLPAAAHTLQQREPLNETELERLGHHYASTTPSRIARLAEIDESTLERL